MKQLRNTVIRAGLEALYFTGAHHLLRPIFSGVGAIFMLHHVRPRRDGRVPAQPSSRGHARNSCARRWPICARATSTSSRMDEMHRRLTERDFSRRFACFTFDDGYRDNRDFALPVMREFDAPLHGLCRQRLRRRHRPAVVGRAGDGDRQGRRDRSADRRHRDPPRYLDAAPPSRRRSTGCTTGCARCRASMTSRARSRRCARAMASMRPRSAASSACPGTS